MARVCTLTGKMRQVGHSVSHSNRKTKRCFYPNLQTKKFFVPETGEWVVMKVSTAAIKTINKIGVSAALKRAAEQGYIIY